MADLKEKTFGTILSTTTGVDMKTAAATTLYTVPVGKVCRVTGIVVRDTSASLAGGTSYTVTNFRAAFSLAALTTASTGYITVGGADLAMYIETAAGVAIQFTVTTGATAAGTATIDLIGYLSA